MLFNRCYKSTLYNARASLTVNINSVTSSTDSIYLRNLPTHTTNNLLRKLNYIKSIQNYDVKQKINIIHIMCENFRAISWVLCKIQLIKFERVKIESHKNIIVVCEQGGPILVCAYAMEALFTF